MSSSTPTSSPMPRHIPALDGVRGLAIALVLVAHCIHLPMGNAGQLGHWQTNVYRWTNMAWSGVELFFVLSGFLITKVLLENRDSPNLFKTFYARRASRILPLYVFVAVAVFAAMHFLADNAFWEQMFGGRLPWQGYATLTQNYFMGASNNYGGDALAATWSLAVEEQFYLVLPWVIRFCPSRYLPWLFASGVPWAYLARMHLQDLRGFVYAPCQADSLLLGCLLAWVCEQPAAYAWLKRQGGGMTVLLALLGAGLMFINRMPEYFGEPVQITWLALFYATLILLAITQHNHPLTKLLSMRWIGFLGMISYGIYLTHFSLQNILYWVVKGTGATMSDSADMIYPVIIIGLSIGLASASWFFFERHWVKLGHRAKF